MIEDIAHTLAASSLLLGALLCCGGSKQTANAPASSQDNWQRGYADVPFPSDANTNPELHKQVVAAYRDAVKRDPKGDWSNFYKIVILSDDWMMDRNDLTGRLLGRYYRLAVAYGYVTRDGHKYGKTDGKCVWQNVKFYSDAQPGGGWGKPYVKGEDVAPVRTTCTNWTPLD